MEKKKEFKYKKLKETLSTKDIKDMLVRDSSNLKYSRINSTIPTPLIEKVDKYFSDEPRSNLITRLLLKEVEVKEKEEFLKEQAKILAKNQHLYLNEMEDWMETSLQDLEEILTKHENKAKRRIPSKTVSE